MVKINSWALGDFSGEQPRNDPNGNPQVGDQITGATVEVSIDDVVVPVSQFMMTYSVNQIPTASAQIALGRNARTQQDSSIYAAVKNIRQMAKVRVRILGTIGDVSAKTFNGSQDRFPPGPATIFMGYVSGLSYRRSAGRISMIVNMVHQLFDLAASSGGTKDMIPGSPHDFLLQTLGQGAGGDIYGSAETRFSNSLPPLLNVDFSQGVMNCLNELATTNLLQTHDEKFWCGGPNVVNQELESNTQAANIINKSGEWEGIATFSESEYMSPYAKKCPLLVHSSGVNKAATVIGQQVASSLAATSMWGMLVNSVLPAFGCGIVPMARGAILAPMLPMAQEAQMVIKPEDYVDFNFSTQSQRPLYGVGVLGSFVLGTLNPERPKVCVGSGFVPDQADDDAAAAEAAEAAGGAAAPTKGTDGMWMFVPAPKWLEDFSNFDSGAIEGNARINVLMGNVSHEAVGEDEQLDEEDPGDEVADWNDATRKYAQMIYATQALRGREGTLVGKLRFDIAPGTTIKIQAKGDEFSAGIDSLATDMYGFVVSSTLVINAEQSAASTTYEIINLRTEEENKKERFAFKAHPFFGDEYFKHAPLVPELAATPAEEEAEQEPPEPEDPPEI